MLQVAKDCEMTFVAQKDTKHLHASFGFKLEKVNWQIYYLIYEKVVLKTKWE